jgi:hypothetical protein
MLLSASLVAQHIPTANVPTGIRSTFASTYPHATGVRWENEHSAYEACFKQNGTEHSATYSSNGVLIEEEREIAVNQLPTSVMSYIRANHQDANLRGAAIIVRNGATFHKVEFHENGLKSYLMFDAQGNMVPATNTDRD